jgi:hypothetical protein
MEAEPGSFSFDAFSSREPGSTSLENAMKRGTSHPDRLEV